MRGLQSWSQSQGQSQNRPGAPRTAEKKPLPPAPEGPPPPARLSCDAVSSRALIVAPTLIAAALLNGWLKRVHLPEGEFCLAIFFRLDSRTEQAFEEAFLHQPVHQAVVDHLTKIVRP